MTDSSFLHRLRVDLAVQLSVFAHGTCCYMPLNFASVIQQHCNSSIQAMPEGALHMLRKDLAHS